MLFCTAFFQEVFLCNYLLYSDIMLASFGTGMGSNVLFLLELEIYISSTSC